MRSSDINDYIKEIAGSEFTAKDFRTWNATLLCSVALAHLSNGSSTKTSRARVVSTAVKRVAEYLGNTPAVCRTSYIDPRVFDRYRSGVTIEAAIDALPEAGGKGLVELHRRMEGAVLDLLLDTVAADRAA